MQLIDGRALAEKIKDGIVAEILKLGDVRPNLAILVVGEREDSKIYVGLKEKQAKLVGIDTHTYNCEAEIAEEDLLNVIEYLNNDEQIDAILLQLPLPGHLDENKIVAAIDPLKDVDGFQPETLKKYLTGQTVVAEPVVPVVAREMLQSIKFDGDGKTAVVVANSEIFGEVMRYELEKIGMCVEISGIEDEALGSLLKGADLIVTAVGKNYLTGEMVSDGVVIIDVGICKSKSGVCGDVVFDTIKDKASYLSPVPGGVGPMTIAVALRNALRLHQQRKV
jgi:methylenetetrahydrofolate dehydrogenase (NADP+)/methenyltetrahydrofolate cyclohydrolase